MISGKSSFSFMLAVFALGIITTISCTRNQKPRVNATALIAKHLGNRYQAAENEALWLDEFRDFYCVFFTIQAPADRIRSELINSGLTPFATNNRERHDVYLYQSEYKRLVKLKWATPIDLLGCDRYVGT
jgi:hypothetical protein